MEEESHTAVKEESPAPADEGTDSQKEEDKSDEFKSDKKRGDRSRGAKRSRSGEGLKSRNQQIARDGRMTNSTDPNLKKSRLFVGNLAVDKVRRGDIMEKFSKYGDITGVSIHRNYAFVQFSDEDSAQKALEGENGTELGGREVTLQRAQGETQDTKRPPERRRRRSRSRERERDDYEQQLRRRWEEDRRHTAEPYDRPRGRSPPRPRGDYGRFDRSRSPPPADYRYERESHSRDRYDPHLDGGYGRPPRDRPFYSRSPERRARSPEHRPWVESARERVPSPRPAAGPLDCEVLISTVDIRRYGEMIARRVRSLGLAVEMVLLTPEISLADMLDDAFRRRLLFSVLVTEQHELHASCTVHVLDGPTKQEHKNMPLDDAMRLLSGGYKEDYRAAPAPVPRESVASLFRRSPTPPPPRRMPARDPSPMQREPRGPSHSLGHQPQHQQHRASGGGIDEGVRLSSALSQVTQGGADDLSAEQLSTLINALQRKQQGLAASEMPSAARPTDYDRAPYDRPSRPAAVPRSPSPPVVPQYERHRDPQPEPSRDSFASAPSLVKKEAAWESEATDRARSSASFYVQPEQGASRPGPSESQAAPLSRGQVPPHSAPVLPSHSPLSTPKPSAPAVGVSVASYGGAGAGAGAGARDASPALRASTGPAPGRGAPPAARAGPGVGAIDHGSPGPGRGRPASNGASAPADRDRGGGGMNVNRGGGAAAGVGRGNALPGPGLAAAAAGGGGGGGGGGRGATHRHAAPASGVAASSSSLLSSPPLQSAPSPAAAGGAGAGEYGGRNQAQYSQQQPRGPYSNQYAGDQQYQQQQQQPQQQHQHRPSHQQPGPHRQSPHQHQQPAQHHQQPAQHHQQPAQHHQQQQQHPAQPPRQQQQQHPAQPPRQQQQQHPAQSPRQQQQQHPAQSPRQQQQQHPAQSPRQQQQQYPAEPRQQQQHPAQSPRQQQQQHPAQSPRQQQQQHSAQSPRQQQQEHQQQEHHHHHQQQQQQQQQQQHRSHGSAPVVVAYPGQRQAGGGSGAYSAGTGYTEGSAYGMQRQQASDDKAAYYTQQKSSWS